MGGEAVANGDDVVDLGGRAAPGQRRRRDASATCTSWSTTPASCATGCSSNMTEEEWDAVIKVHLKGTFGPARWAAAYWREQVKAGEPVDGRIINTTSVSGIYGNPGQTNYGAAKAGIAAFTIIAALELGALRRHRQRGRPGRAHPHDRGPRPGAGDRGAARSCARPRWIAPIVTWLASTGVERRHRAGLRGVRPGARRRRGLAPRPEHAPVDDPTKLGPIVAELLARPGPTRAWTASPAAGRSPRPASSAGATERAGGHHHADQPRCRRRRRRPGRGVAGRRKDALLYAVGIGAGTDELAVHHREHERRRAAGRCPRSPSWSGGAGRRRRGQDRHVQPGDARARPAGGHAAPARSRSRARRR